MAIIRWNPARELTRMERIMRDLDQTSDEPASMAIWVPPVATSMIVRASNSGTDV
jgi:hypothetical protein